MFTVLVMGRRRVILTARFLAGGVMLTGSVSGSAPDKLSAYAYEDTRRLVALVEQAAKLMEEEGESVFAEFGRKGSRKPPITGRTPTVAAREWGAPLVTG